MKAGELNGQITIGVFSSSSPVSATVPVRYDRGIEYLKSRGYEMIHGSLQGKQDFTDQELFSSGQRNLIICCITKKCRF